VIKKKQLQRDKNMTFFKYIDGAGFTSSLLQGSSYHRKYQGNSSDAITFDLLQLQIREKAFQLLPSGLTIKILT
jgi:hypothetical protein